MECHHGQQGGGDFHVAAELNAFPQGGLRLVDGEPVQVQLVLGPYSSKPRTPIAIGQLSSLRATVLGVTTVSNVLCGI